MLRCGRCGETWAATPGEPITAPAALAPALTEPLTTVPVKDSPPHGSGTPPDGDHTSLVAIADSPSIIPDPILPYPIIPLVIPGPVIPGPAIPESVVAEPDLCATDLEGRWLTEVPFAKVTLARSRRPSWFWRRFRSQRKGRARKFRPPLKTACTVMAAMIAATLLWRVDVVRILPQTALFYRLLGLEVNLRGLGLQNIQLSSETINGKPVWLIEGQIVATTRIGADIPQLRFSVRDAQGSEIYAWNTTLESHLVKPGEQVAFRSRLASPPKEGRRIDIRFVGKPA